MAALQPLPRGLINDGRTCAWNSVLQGYLPLLSPGMVDRLCADAESSVPNTRLVARAILDTLLQLIEPNNPTPVDSLFTKACQAVFPEFGPGRQHDAAELHGAVLELLPGLQYFFSGTASFSTTCASCGTTRPTPSERFDIVHVPLGVGVTNLLDEFEGVFLPSPMHGREQQHCGECGGLRDGERTLAVETVPPILCLQLLRFDNRGRKDARPVDYDSLFVADALFSEPYVLRATVSHDGATRHSGHYTGRVFDARRQEWVTCDDRSVTIAANEHAEQAYLLFFQVCIGWCGFFLGFFLFY